MAAPTIQIRRFGGPDVLELVDAEPAEPGPGEISVDVTVVGVNYRDIYERNGTRPLSDPPLVPGLEGAGRVRALGPGVTGLAAGDRVAWKNAPGSYTAQAVVPAFEAVPLPEDISDETAAAVLLQGLTAHYLATSTYPIKAGDTALVHAAAGGVGLLLTQMVKILGGRVIGTVSTDAKAQLAREAGADEIIRYDQTEVAPAVRELTGGEGVPVVYDAVGASTFDASLASLRPRGLLALYGAASGPVPPFDLQRLAAGGSLSVTRPTLTDFTRTREELLARTEQVFGWIRDGKLRVHIGGRYPLAEASRAQEDLEQRRTVGKLLLLT